MTRTFVVMEARIGSRTIWGWGEVGDGPGFEEVYFTEADGFTPAELFEAPTLSKFLFSVTVPTNQGERRMGLPILLDGEVGR